MEIIIFVGILHGDQFDDTVHTYIKNGFNRDLLVFLFFYSSLIANIPLWIWTCIDINQSPASVA